MKARIFVAVVVGLVFVGRGVPDVRLSAVHEDSIVLDAAQDVEQPHIVSTIVFTSTRDNTTGVPRIVGGEIYFIDYLSNGSFSTPRRVTTNEYADIFPALSPDGRGKIVFDSNRLRADAEPSNTSDLFLMNHDGTDQVFLTRGGSPSWSPAGPEGQPARMIAFHASSSGVGLPVNAFPGAATNDSDIFVVNVDDLLENGGVPQNITPNRGATVDDDPNWSPDGRKILFTSYVNDPSTTLTSAEIHVMDADGGYQQQLTSDGVEKRGPAWSPNGETVVFACRQGALNNGVATFEICVMEVATGQITQLTTLSLSELTPTWSPDGELIVFHRAPANQLWVMRKDGSFPTQLTIPAKLGELNLLATSWGVIGVGQHAR